MKKSNKPLTKADLAVAAANYGKAYDQVNYGTPKFQPEGKHFGELRKLVPTEERKRIERAVDIKHGHKRGRGL